jgi:hypothetical protein
MNIQSAAHTNRSGEAVAATPAPPARRATASLSSPIVGRLIGQAVVVDRPAPQPLPRSGAGSPFLPVDY